MKTYVLSFAVLLLATSFAAADWVLVQKNTNPGNEDQITTKIKGEQARVDIGSKMTVIMGAEGMTMLMHEQKMVMKKDQASIKAVVDAASKAGEGKQIAKPVATGQKEKVGEWDTEIYTWEGPMGKGRFWVAKAFPKHAEINALSDKLGKTMGSTMAGFSPQASDFDGMVVKSEMTMMGKNMTTQLISAKEEEVDAKEFLPPQGYNEVKMPGAPTK